MSREITLTFRHLSTLDGLKFGIRVDDKVYLGQELFDNFNRNEVYAFDIVLMDKDDIEMEPDWDIPAW